MSPQLCAEGKLELAEPLARETREMSAEILGEAHPFTQLAQGSLAGLLREQGKAVEAAAGSRQRAAGSRLREQGKAVEAEHLTRAAA